MSTSNAEAARGTAPSTDSADRPASVWVGGAPGSPYTRKMLSVLRYRRIPFEFLNPPQVIQRGLSWAKVPLLPTLWFPQAGDDMLPHTDSSPLIRRFERSHHGRHVTAPDPVLAFVDMLIEDYADEWLTKVMFHYRWTRDDDIDRAARVLPHWRGLSRPDDQIAEASRAFAERQIGRLHVVGSNTDTAAVIEASYPRFLIAFDALLQAQPFLSGHRPGAADFAVFGQLTQLAQFDPTPMRITLEHSARVFAWVSWVEDLSGLEPVESDWVARGSRPPQWQAVLTEIGRTYVPVMLANAAAIRDGQAEVRVDLDGASWVQRAFPYQAKCLNWLGEAYAQLSETDRAAVDHILDGTGCERLLVK